VVLDDKSGIKMIFKGRCISGGVARGPAILWDSAPVLAAALRMRPSGPATFELERLNAAIGRACVQIDRTKRQLAWRVTDPCEAIFDRQAGLLRDAAFIGKIEHVIVDNDWLTDARIEPSSWMKIGL
jgi:phosphoenolpyruvate-protein kinase (PTS system EI component)